MTKAREGREIVAIVDETGDKKKGEKTDCVKRQYIGDLGKVENGIVSVNSLWKKRRNKKKKRGGL